MSTRCAHQVGLSRLHCCSSICKNNCFKHFVISQELLGQSTLVSTRCAQPVGLRRLHWVLQFVRITVISILSYLRNYFANRPDCQRVVLSRLGCADYTVVSSICKNKCFKHFVKPQKLLANRPECQRVLLSKLGCADYSVVSSFCRMSVLNMLSYLRNYWANRSI